MRERAKWVASAAIAVVFAAGMALQAEDPSIPSSRSRGRRGSRTTAGTGTSSSKITRLRQGTILEKVKGEFRLAGDRVAFYPLDLDVKEMTVLENLALERLSELVAENRRRVWLINATVTEFRGKNYLLVSRAVLTSEFVKSPLEP